MFALLTVDGDVKKFDADMAEDCNQSVNGGVMVDEGGIIFPVTPDYAERLLSGKAGVSDEITGMFKSCFLNATRVVRENVSLKDAYEYLGRLCVTYWVPKELVKESLARLGNLGGAKFKDIPEPFHPAVSPAFVYNGEATVCVTYERKR